MTRRAEGAALLIAGHGAIGGNALDASAVHALGQIGEALLATGSGWQIRRLSAAVGERFGADRGTIKQQLDELVAQDARAIVLVVLGSIVDAGGPALLTSSEVRAYPEDATLSLAWIGERLRSAKAEQVLAVISARRPASPPGAWVEALASKRGEHVIAADAPDAGAPILDALLAGLCGDAVDRRTGTVTMSSLSALLATRVPSAVIQASDASQTFAMPPPLGGLWDVRRSQLAGARPRASGSEDLTGSVLPGRFRVDAVLARGTFGTVYRAHQLAVERDVAVKVLNADIDPSSEDGRLFVHEIRAVGRMDHPNVVRIHQADITHDGRLFFAMELLAGRDLQQIVTGGPIAKDCAIEIMRKLLAGLAAAHDAGLVHADIKPANAILVEKRATTLSAGADDAMGATQRAADVAAGTARARPAGRASDDANGVRPQFVDASTIERVVLVDFGLARLRHPDRAAESAGGTPAYMAPEQLQEGRVDARSDLFSAALVLVALLTGWRRKSARDVVPDLHGIADPQLRAVLDKALALDPAKRYQSAREFTAALNNEDPDTETVTPLLPFRLFASLTEADRGRLHGRETDLATLIDHVLYRPRVIYTAPSGTGKTSLLRAGLAPRLEALDCRVVYVRCRAGSAATVREALASASTSRLVIVLDQLEAALADGDRDLIAEVLAIPAAANVSIVLSIREDFLARLVTQLETGLAGTPICRLPPLHRAGARDAIVKPLAEARLAIDPELLDALLGDLENAAASLAPQMGWGATAAVYPPHLQLACSMLYDSLGTGEATITLAHYRKLGGFEAIVGEHLERVLDVELADGRDAIARDLFVALVTTAHERAMRPEAELLAIASASHDRAHVIAVLELLRERGLVVRVRTDGDPCWELVHDSLVPRVLAWIDSRDLAKRRAIELVRYHLRRSTDDVPSLLGRSELRELRAHHGAIAELDREWTREGFKPSQLVALSRSALRRRAATFAGVITLALGFSTAAVVRNRIQAAEQREQESLRDRDMGTFTLELAPFDWDPAALHAIPVAAASLPDLQWELHYPDDNDPDEVGATFRDEHLVRGGALLVGDPLVRAEHVETHGGHAFLVIRGRRATGPQAVSDGAAELAARGGGETARVPEAGRGDDCGASVIPLAHLPGFAQRHHGETLIHVAVPTCQATRASMIAIDGGPFIYGGPGEPASTFVMQFPRQATERTITLRAFLIDRTEVTNAAFSTFAALEAVTGIAPPSYPESPQHVHVADPESPVSSVTWTEARAFCQFLGKRLPTSQQWQRALRGGLTLADGTPNPMPRRNLPWGAPRVPAPANLFETGAHGPAAVGSFTGDRSPDGVLDLAGNVYEWTRAVVQDNRGFRMIRGAAWTDLEGIALHDSLAIENQRAMSQRLFDIGFRCVVDD